MNADDRVMTMLAKANPRPSDEPIPSPVPASAYLATLEKRSSEMTKLDTRIDEAPRPTPRLRRLAAAVAIVIIAGVALIFQTRVDEGPTPATDQPVTPTTTSIVTPSTAPEVSLDPQVAEALSVATAFMEARVNRDMPGIEANSIDGHIIGFVSGSFDLMDEEFAWQEAVGWQIELRECEVTNDALTNTRIRCSVSHQNSISEALGEGPFDGSYSMRLQHPGEERLGVRIETTTVTEALDITFPIAEFTNGTWRPFEAWLEANHPEDAAKMYGAEVTAVGELWVSAGERNPLLTQESIDLWRQNVAEFVAEQSG